MVTGVLVAGGVGEGGTGFSVNASGVGESGNWNVAVARLTDVGVASTDDAPTVGDAGASIAEKRPGSGGSSNTGVPENAYSASAVDEINKIPPSR